MDEQFIDMSSKSRLRRLLEEWAAKPQYQRGYGKWPNGKEKTYCNMYATAVGVELGYNMQSFYREHSGRYATRSPMNLVYDQLIQDNVKQVTASEAQAIANLGNLVVVWSKKYDHAAVICPDSQEYNEARGPLVCQAGWWNGVMYISDGKSFGRNWQDPEILFVVPEKREGR